MRHTVLFGLFLLLLTGCFKDPEATNENPDETEEEEAFDLVAPQGFDFDMAYDYSFTMEVALPDGSAGRDIPFWVYSARPQDGGRLMAKLLSDDNGQFTVNVSLPASHREIIIYTTSTQVPKAQVIPIDPANRINTRSNQWGADTETDGDLELYELLQAAYSVDNDNCPVKFYQVLFNNLKQLNPINGTYVPIGAASANYNGIGLNTEDGELYGYNKSGDSTYLWLIDKDTGAETDLGAVSNISGNGFNYKSDFDLNGNLVNINVIDNVWNLVYVDVSEFSTNKAATFVPLTKIGSVGSVYDMAYNEQEDCFYSLDNSGHVVRIDPNAKTIQRVGDYNAITGRVTVGAVWSDVNGYCYFSENNGGRIFFCQIDENGNSFNFRQISTGESASNNDGASCVLAPSPFDLITDTDGDGTPDLLDEDPNNAEVEVIEETISLGAGNTGTYAFEDKWPQMGDYDFNDVVIDYGYQYYLNTAGKITQINATFITKAVGAAWKNGFGVAFEGIQPGVIKSVTGTEAAGISTNANGCEANQSKAVVIIFDDAHQLFGRENDRTFINTKATGPFYTPDTIRVTIEMETPVTTAELGVINPFIFSAGDRGREIHLLNYPPTDLADASYFATFSDKSNVGQSKYYLGENNFPWGLNFPSTFNHPLEKVNVSTSYSDFEDWVLTSGASKTDWFLRTKATPGKIYDR